MEKIIGKLELECTELYKELFDEVSKLQIEEKFLERQAQTLIDEIRNTGDENIIRMLEEMIEMNDPDFILQNEHLKHMEILKQESEEPDINNILKEEFGCVDSEFYAYSGVKIENTEL